MESKYDFKNLLEIAFNSMDWDSLQHFLENEEVPFEFCEKALKQKGVNWSVKLAIAKRSDCPEDVMLKLCGSGAGEKFVCGFLYNGHDSIRRPEKAIDKLIDGGRYWMLAEYWMLTDEQRNRLYGKFASEYHSWSLIKFIHSQIMLPDGSLDKVKDRVEYEVKCPCGEEDAKIIMDVNLPCMLTPFEDEFLEMVLKLEERERKIACRQIAANPSISDYVIMELLVKASNADEINYILEQRKDARDEYRRTHGQE